MIFRPVTPASADGPPWRKEPGRVGDDVDFLPVPLTERPLQELLPDVRLDLWLAHGPGVLRADEDRLDLHGPAVAVPHAHLRLRVGPKPVDPPFVPVSREEGREPVGEEDRQRHPFRRLVGGVAEHQPLIAGSPDSNGPADFRSLPGYQLPNGNAVGVEGFAGIRVTDAANHLPRDGRRINRRLGGDLPGNDDVSPLAENLAGHPGIPVGRDMRIQDRVRDEIADLVRVPLGHRLGGEDEFR